MDLSSFLSALSSAKDYRAFVRNDLAELLNRLGEIQYDVGASFLKQSQHSYDKDGEIRSAITCFAQAFEHFSRAYDDPSLLAQIRSVVPGGFGNRLGKVDAARRAFETASILAVIYTGTENYPLAWDWLQRARWAFHTYSSTSKELYSGVRRLIADTTGERYEREVKVAYEWREFTHLGKNVYEQLGTYGVMRRLAAERENPFAHPAWWEPVV